MFHKEEAVPIATYVIADIHGEYEMFVELPDKIHLQENDILYVLGDVLDRGKHPIKTLLKLMEMPNVICIVGNLATWQYNGCQTTIDEFRRLDSDAQQDVIDYIEEFLLYEEVSIGDKEYLLVHAGRGNYVPDKDIEDYSLHDLVWNRADYEKKYFENVYVITGHTPTQTIAGNPKPGFIYKHNHIAIDCGACFPGGRLAAICLDTGEEFYSSINEEM